MPNFKSGLASITEPGEEVDHLLADIGEDTTGPNADAGPPASWRSSLGWTPHSFWQLQPNEEVSSGRCAAIVDQLSNSKDSHTTVYFLGYYPVDEARVLTSQERRILPPRKVLDPTPSSKVAVWESCTRSAKGVENTKATFKIDSDSTARSLAGSELGTIGEIHLSSQLHSRNGKDSRLRYVGSGIPSTSIVKVIRTGPATATSTGLRVELQRPELQILTNEQKTLLLAATDHLTGLYGAGDIFDDLDDTKAPRSLSGVFSSRASDRNVCKSYLARLQDPSHSEAQGSIYGKTTVGVTQRKK